MKNPELNYWNQRLTKIKENFEENNFEVFIAQSVEEAKENVLNKIMPPLEVKSISWGGSITFIATGLFHILKDDERYKVINTFDKTISAEEQMERRRQSLLVDLFITGTNAITEDGKLVNLDMIGNRIGGITFGPRNVIILVGRNKICCDIDDAMYRIKNYAAPVNTMNLDKKTPCSKTGFCHNCQSPDRICNTWVITEKCFPAKRVKIVLINEDLGF
ncbi:MAG: lactate utilization protein [Desulfamplus sp.]|nr:lactate utilization protein [Desulfamplus sp.]MBF0411918.1 lactate utilization protein [Desulfamplus sp.]